MERGESSFAAFVRVWIEEDPELLADSKNRISIIKTIPGKEQHFQAYMNSSP
jgi:hypothetical protein